MEVRGTEIVILQHKCSKFFINFPCNMVECGRKNGSIIHASVMCGEMQELKVVKKAVGTHFLHCKFYENITNIFHFVLFSSYF